jgi:sugar/nucleoside kinase (ribokinase family)
MLDYLAVGHVSADVAPDGRVNRGGAVSFAARTAATLGLNTGLVTRSEPGTVSWEPLAGVDCRVVPSSATTSFSNRYDRRGRRHQELVALAPTLRPADIPAEWRRVGILHLAPIAHEVTAGIAAAVRADFIGLTPQGWLRRLAVGAPVTPQPVGHIPSALLARADAVVLSEEDVGGDAAELRWLAERVPLLVATRGERGAVAYHGGRTVAVPAAEAKVVDPTGAGDVFATAFFIRCHECGEVETALRFAAAAAALSIEAPGLSGIGDRQAVEARLARRG